MEQPARATSPTHRSLRKTTTVMRKRTADERTPIASSLEEDLRSSIQPTRNGGTRMEGVDRSSVEDPRSSIQDCSICMATHDSATARTGVKCTGDETHYVCLSCLCLYVESQCEPAAAGGTYEVSPRAIQRRSGSGSGALAPAPAQRLCVCVLDRMLVLTGSQAERHWRELQCGRATVPRLSDGQLRLREHRRR
jgi:hypothetical protein